MIGIEPAHLKDILESGDPCWSDLNRIIKPLGYHVVIQKIHRFARKKPRIGIKQVKFKGRPLDTEQQGAKTVSN